MVLLEQEHKSGINIKPLENLLDVSDLKTYFHLGKGKVAKAVDGLSFYIRRGETVALVGESGSGKSVTSLSIMRLVPSPAGNIENGSILLDGRELLHLREKEMDAIRGNDIGMIFQEPMTSLDPVFTIGSQIMEPLMKHKKMNRKEAYDKGVELLEQVGFARADKIMREYPHQLSGGMKQRVMIAIAMSCEPSLLIADEPTTALDVTIQAQILDLMLEMQQRIGAAILLVTHDLGIVAETADRVLVMYAGQIVEETDVRTLFKGAMHPYTKGLLNSMPTLDLEVERLAAIPGNVPPSHEFPAGCRFADRCEFAGNRCIQEQPELQDVAPGQKVRCHLFTEKGVTIDG